MPNEEVKEPDVGPEKEPDLEEVRAAFEAARLRVKALAKQAREGERVPGDLLNLRLKSYEWIGR